VRIGCIPFSTRAQPLRDPSRHGCAPASHTTLIIERTVMNGYHHPHESLRLAHDHQDRLRRHAGRSRLYREAKRLRSRRHTP
jgi:hypothetical protein